MPLPHNKRASFSDKLVLASAEEQRGNIDAHLSNCWLFTGIPMDRKSSSRNMGRFRLLLNMKLLHIKVGT